MMMLLRRPSAWRSAHGTPANQPLCKRTALPLPPPPTRLRATSPTPDSRCRGHESPLLLRAPACDPESAASGSGGGGVVRGVVVVRLVLHSERHHAEGVGSESSGGAANATDTPNIPRHTYTCITPKYVYVTLFVSYMFMYAFTLGDVAEGLRCGWVLRRRNERERCDWCIMF